MRVTVIPAFAGITLIYKILCCFLSIVQVDWAYASVSSRGDLGG